MSRASQGVSTTEYVTLGGLIVVLAVVGITTLGDSVHSLFGKMKSDMQQTATPNTTNAPKSLAEIEGLEALTEEDPDLQNRIKALNSSIQTLGANGTTKLFANRLIKVTKFLKNNDSISSEDEKTLLDLANAGHKLASAQRLALHYIQHYKNSPQQLKNITIQFDGITYNGLNAFTKQFGAETLVPKNIINADQQVMTAKAGKILKPFYQLVLEAKSIPLNEQETYIINDAINSIIYTAELVEHTVNTSQGNLHGSILDTGVLPDQVDDDSATICETGDNQDNGSQCY